MTRINEHTVNVMLPGEHAPLDPRAALTSDSATSIHALVAQKLHPFLAGSEVEPYAQVCSCRSHNLFFDSVCPFCNGAGTYESMSTPTGYVASYYLRYDDEHVGPVKLWTLHSRHHGYNPAAIVDLHGRWLQPTNHDPREYRSCLKDDARALVVSVTASMVEPVSWQILRTDNRARETVSESVVTSGLTDLREAQRMTGGLVATCTNESLTYYKLEGNLYKPYRFEP